MTAEDFGNATPSTIIALLSNPPEKLPFAMAMASIQQKKHQRDEWIRFALPLLRGDHANQT